MVIDRRGNATISRRYLDDNGSPLVSVDRAVEGGERRCLVLPTSDGHASETSLPGAYLDEEGYLDDDLLWLWSPPWPVGRMVLDMSVPNRGRWVAWASSARETAVSVSPPTDSEPLPLDVAGTGERAVLSVERPVPGRSYVVLCRLESGLKCDRFEMESGYAMQC